jgi:ankyrin repeat protein
MTTPRVLPSRPSFESLRKQAKKLAREIAAGNADAVARVHAQLLDAELPLSQRDAQLVLAREYGFAGWQDLRAEVLKRTGKGLEWAVLQAERAIHDNDVEGLKQLLVDYPALLSWQDEDGGVLLHATTAFAMDVSDPERERQFYRPDCAALLIDAGAVIVPSVWEGVIGTGAAGMLQLLQQKGVLPRTLQVLAALGDLDGVRACFDDSGVLGASPPRRDAGDLAVVNKAFMNACRFKHKTVASMLLDRCIALDGELGQRIDRWQGRSAFVEYLFEHYPAVARSTPWRAFVARQLVDAMDEDNLPVFGGWLKSEPWLLADSCLALQVEILEQATLRNRGPFIAQLLELDPAVLHRPTPPPSSALIFAFEYGNAHLVPLLMRIWPLPDDLPHAAGLGNLVRVKHWFDDAGQPALGELSNHYPANNSGKRLNLQWSADNAQRVLDTALAWACVNKQFETASFLLAHGADINTNWSTHEPASILHECALHKNYEAARFLIEHGIDLTIRDYRWNATAEGWSYNAVQDEEMTELLAAAAEQRKQNQ